MQTKDDAPVEAGLGAEGRLQAIAQYDVTGCAVTKCTVSPSDVRWALQTIQSQSAEILKLGHARDFWKEQAEALAPPYSETRALTAATEGQSYWQARAERAEAGLREIQNKDKLTYYPYGNPGLLVSELGPCGRIAAQTLADAQQTQKPEEVRS